jgi:hypothetical protein
VMWVRGAGYSGMWEMWGRAYTLGSCESLVAKTCRPRIDHNASNGASQ